VHIVLYEDSNYLNFKPLCDFHPIFDLYYGYRKIYQKVEDISKKIKIEDISYLGRQKQLNSFLDEKGFTNKMFDYSDDVLFINSRIKNIDVAFTLNPGESIIDDYEDIMAIRVKKYSKNPFDINRLFSNTLNIDGFKKINSKSNRYLFDFIKDIEEEFIRDFNRNKDYYKKNYKEIQKDVFIGANTIVSKLVDFNTSNGPIIIEENCVINPFSAFFGPVYVNSNSVIDRAYIREGSVIGNTCKVSGELEAIYISDFSNKHHDGFFGHSYLGEWVNIGAMSTTSDLKNNYSNIKFELNNKLIDSGANKMGSLFGDHVKTAIGTMINCGTVIHPCSVLFASPSQKTVDRCMWGNELYNEEKLIKTSIKIAGRRKKEFKESYIELFHELFLNILK